MGDSPKPELTQSSSVQAKFNPSSGACSRNEILGTNPVSAKQVGVQEFDIGGCLSMKKHVFFFHASGGTCPKTSQLSEEDEQHRLEAALMLLVGGVFSLWLRLVIHWFSTCYSCDTKIFSTANRDEITTIYDETFHASETIVSQWVQNDLLPPLRTIKNTTGASTAVKPGNFGCFLQKNTPVENHGGFPLEQTSWEKSPSDAFDFRPGLILGVGPSDVFGSLTCSCWSSIVSNWIIIDKMSWPMASQDVTLPFPCSGGRGLREAGVDRCFNHERLLSSKKINRQQMLKTNKPNFITFYQHLPKFELQNNRKPLVCPLSTRSLPPWKRPPRPAACSTAPPAAAWPRWRGPGRPRGRRCGCCPVCSRWATGSKGGNRWLKKTRKNVLVVVWAFENVWVVFRRLGELELIQTGFSGIHLRDSGTISASGGRSFLLLLTIGFNDFFLSKK